MSSSQQTKAVRELTFPHPTDDDNSQPQALSLRGTVTCKSRLSQGSMFRIFTYFQLDVWFKDFQRSFFLCSCAPRN